MLLAILCKKSISFCKKISLLGTPSSGCIWIIIDKGKGRGRGRGREKALPQWIK